MYSELVTLCMMLVYSIDMKQFLATLEVSRLKMHFLSYYQNSDHLMNSTAFVRIVNDGDNMTKIDVSIAVHS